MKNLKKWRTKIIVIAVVILAIVVGMIGISIRSAQRQREYNSHIEAAEKYLVELDYEQAIVEYTLALAIEPKNVELLDSLEQTYLDYAQSLADAGEYEKAVSVLEDGYAQIGRESLREKMEELQELQAQKEAEEAEARRLEEEAEARMIELPFEPMDITIMGYHLFTDHYEDICAAYGCPIDTDPSDEKDYDNSTVENEYGRLSSDVSSVDDGMSYFLSFRQEAGNVDYPAISYSVQKSGSHSLRNISVYSSSDWAANLEACGIKLPAAIGSYDEWCRIFRVEEIKEKGEPQETENGMSCWKFQTKWGSAYYTEAAADNSSHLQIMLNGLEVGEERYDGMFAIDRYVDTNIGADVWTYQYNDY